jgi:hypothetical protein
MAKFTATIQLHNAEKSDYDKLDLELAKQLFKGNKTSSPEIKGPATVWKEYSLEGNITLREVNSVIVRAATKTGKEYSFTVMRNKQIYN